MEYYRPLAQYDAARPPDALTLAGGWCWFDRVEVLSRTAAPRLIQATDLPEEARLRLTEPRAPLGTLGMDRPQLMGILNVTPDSFSDGGRFAAAPDALAHARAMVAVGADILDIGGESTRPGAETIAPEKEIARTAPVIAALRAESIEAPISIDTRKADVARSALDAGAALINDVAAFTFDPAMAALAAERGAPVCLMHAQGTPQTMQQNPVYENVVLDVYDWLAGRIDTATAAGIPRSRIVIDPGIGFGKTQDHNLALLRALSLFHGFGCPILLGASRKRFIGTIGRADEAHRRMPGSVAVALAGVAQGVQVLRVHDVAETDQALRLWSAATGTGDLR